MHRTSCSGLACPNGANVFYADRVIVTVTPPVASLIRYDPPLDPLKSSALRTIHMHKGIRVVLVFKEAFWGTHSLDVITDLPAANVMAVQNQFESGARSDSSYISIHSLLMGRKSSNTDPQPIMIYHLTRETLPWNFVFIYH